jgi:hypothetical protein
MPRSAPFWPACGAPARLFTFLDHPEVAPDNTSSERDLCPTATDRKVTGGFRSDRGPNLFRASEIVSFTIFLTGILNFLI